MSVRSGLMWEDIVILLIQFIFAYKNNRIYNIVTIGAIMKNIIMTTLNIIQQLC